VRSENLEKIIEVMADVGREMALQDLVQSFCKEVEYIGCRATAEAKGKVVEVLVVPCESQQMPVGAADRNVMECGLEIKFDNEGTGP
jgi:hypothetical protein